MRSWSWLVLVALVAGCALPGPAPSTTPTGATTTPTVTVTTPSPTTPTTPAPTLLFDGEDAFAHVERQVLDAEGRPRYRVPGTPGNDEVAAYIAGSMAAYGYDVWWHHFNATYGCQEVAMHNVVAQRNGTSGRMVVFAAHYDTRPIADKDANASARDRPIVGANDGGSGVGVLLELAGALTPDAGNDTLRFLFFDGEDGGGYGGAGCTDWILGSRAYAANLSAEEVASIRALVLVDMVGDADLRLPWEGYSRAGPGRAVQDEIYATAAALGHDAFVQANGQHIIDDHVPFLERGVPAVDLIHLTADGRVFPSWHHTHDDDLDSVSPESLAQVGRTLEAWYRSTSG